MTNIIIITTLLLCALIAYLLGSIPFSYIFTKKLKHEDIREKGSGNAGTTNVLRNYGWGMGIITLVCDLLKGLLSAYIGFLLFGLIGMYVASVFSVVGHNYSCFLKFKGGKGIACSIGVMLLIQTIPTIVILSIALVIVLVTRLMSLGSVIGLILSVIAAFVFHTTEVYLLIAVVAIGILGLYGHRENIKRLLSGTEAKLNISKKA